MILNLLSTLLVISAFAKSDRLNKVPPQRFQPHIDILRETLSKEQTVAEALNDLTKGQNRIAAFSLQALGQIYQDYKVKGSEDYFRNTLRFEAKSLEDAIGRIDKWKDVLKHLKKSKAEESQIQNAHKSLKLSYQLLQYVLTGNKTEVLQTSNLTPEFEVLIKKYEDGKKQSQYTHSFWVNSHPNLMDRMETDLKEFDWLSYNKDRRYVLKRLTKRLEELENTEFNFSLLEDTDSEKGLHEFRREVRWFSYQVRTLNGTVTYFENIHPQEASCPSEELSTLLQSPYLNKTPYTILPISSNLSENICGISKCLMYSVVQLIKDVGRIKNKVEKQNYLEDLNNITPADSQKSVESFYENFMNSRTIDLLKSQLNSCI